MSTMKMFRSLCGLLLKPFVLVIQLVLTLFAVALTAVGSIGELIGGLLGLVFVTMSLLGLLMGKVEGIVFWEMFLMGIAFKAIPSIVRALGEEGIFAIKGALYKFVRDI